MMNSFIKYSFVFCLSVGTVSAIIYVGKQYYARQTPSDVDVSSPVSEMPSRALVGIENIGKTVLLDALSRAVSIIAGPRLIILALSCDTNDQTPRCSLCRCLCIPTNSSWDTVKCTLEKRKLKVFVIIDDFNLVFSDMFITNGKEYIRDVIAIGGDKKGMFHCILSGRSSLLRRLITAKITPDEVIRHRLVNYSGIDLNGTKFSFQTLLPFNKDIDLSALIEFFKVKYNRSAVDINIQTLLIETGGYPGMVEEFIRTGKFSIYKHTIGLRGLTDSDRDKYRILQKLMVVVAEMQTNLEMHYESNSVEFSWVEMFSVDQIDRTVLTSLLFELADLGYIVYEDLEHYPMIGFFSSTIYLEMVAQSEEKLTMTELLALRNPVNSYAEKAEWVTAKILMEAKDLLSTVMGISEVSQYPKGLTGIPELVLPSALPKSESDLTALTPLKGVFLKECLGETKKRDALGADLVFIEQSGVVHRIQLKLGTANMALRSDNLQKQKETTLSSVACNFKTNWESAVAAYERMGLSLNNSRHYLITTRNVIPKDGVLFESGEDEFSINGKPFVLISNKLMKQHKVWPSQARDLGQPFK